MGYRFEARPYPPAGSSSDQTPMRLDGRLQVIQECGHNVGRNRARPSDSQEAIFARARPISEFRITQADLGTSTRVSSLPERESRTCRFGLNLRRKPKCRAP